MDLPRTASHLKRRASRRPLDAQALRTVERPSVVVYNSALGYCPTIEFCKRRVVNFFGLDLSVFGDQTLELATAFVVLSGFAGSFYKYGRWLGNKKDKEEIERLSAENGELKADVDDFEQKFSRLEDVVGNPQDFWLQKPDYAGGVTEHAGQISTSIPIISVINFKGGVGKTTLCGNLAGYFARQGKRVLLIDFDYQGSLSDTVLSHAKFETARYLSHQLLEPHHEPSQIRDKAERLSSLHSGLWFYPAFY